MKWHSGWKMQRLRGVQLALVYGDLLKSALSLLASDPAAAAAPVDDATWHMPPPVFGAGCHESYCGRPYRCATSVLPTTGMQLQETIDAQAGTAGTAGGAGGADAATGGLNATRWELLYANAAAASATALGHDKCGYVDSKQQLTGHAGSGWLFFKLPQVSAEDNASVGFCGDFPSDMDLAGLSDVEAEGAESDPLLVLVNGEEVQGAVHALQAWPAAKTLGSAFQCFSTTANVFPGDNELGFRVMDPKVTVKLTHVLWS